MTARTLPRFVSLALLLTALSASAQEQVLDPAAVRHRLFSPEENMEVARLMLPAMSRSERLGFLSMARDGAPPEMFDAVLQFAAKPTLPREDWIHLSEGLGLAA